MKGQFNNKIIDNFRDLYAEGFRCIKYEIDERDNLFTVYLKDFNQEKTKTLKYDAEEGTILKNYIDRLS